MVLVRSFFLCLIAFTVCDAMAQRPSARSIETALSEAGMKVPGDVAFVGAGNIHYGDMLSVPLTTVSWSKSAMGQEAASLLLELIEGKKKVRKITVPPELIIRRSCGAVQNLATKSTKNS